MAGAKHGKPSKRQNKLKTQLNTIRLTPLDVAGTKHHHSRVKLDKGIVDGRLYMYCYPKRYFAKHWSSNFPMLSGVCGLFRLYGFCVIS